MNVLILLAVVLIGIFTIMGFRVGLVRRIVEFVGLVASFLLATNLAPHWYGLLAGNTALSDKASLYITWAVLFLVGLLLARLVAWGVSKTIRISILGWVDRLGGALFGLLMGTVLASVVVSGVSQVPGGTVVRDAFCERPVSRAIYQAAPWLLETFRRLGGDEQEVWDKVLEEARKRTETSAAPSSSSGLLASVGRG